MDATEMVSCEWRGKDFTLEMHPVENAPSALCADVGDVHVVRSGRNDGSQFWHVSIEYPACMDPGDGYTHVVSACEDELPQALDSLMDQLDQVIAWARHGKQALLALPRPVQHQKSTDKCR